MDVQTPIPSCTIAGSGVAEPAASTVAAAPYESPAPKEKPSGRTPLGSQSARRNALKLGLHARAVFPEHLEISIGKIQGELTDHYQPRPGVESRLIRDMAVNWAKLEFCEELRKLDVQRIINQ